ncbi:MAG: bifunctional UDP-N-acetylglucosamine diphosphorylase/glucosamine-1-phosphate N-acetyltransferase GlmU, partial [Terriglobales bacterium]
MRTAALILAAGRGTRMRSRLPKVLHAAGGRSLLGHVLAAVQSGGLAAADVAVVGGYAADQIQAALAATGVHFVRQEPQLGTGHAVLAARDWWRGYYRVLVVHGDMPLLSATTVAALAAGRADAVLATASPAEPRAYGRIVRDPKRPERIVAIVEERQASDEQKRIRELNAGFYSFSTAALAPALEQLGTSNPHGEYYLTDTIALLAGRGLAVAGLPLADPDECLGVNDRAELAQLDLFMRRRKAAELLAAGVSIELPESVVLDAGVEVGMDTVLEPGVQLRGATRIGENCRIRTGAVLENCVLGEGVLVRPYSVLENAHVAAGAQIGPFARLREGAEIGEQAHIGNFVEVK